MYLCLRPCSFISRVRNFPFGSLEWTSPGTVHIEFRVAFAIEARSCIRFTFLSSLLPPFQFGFMASRLPLNQNGFFRSAVLLSRCILALPHPLTATHHFLVSGPCLCPYFPSNFLTAYLYLDVYERRLLVVLVGPPRGLPRTRRAARFQSQN